MSDNPKSSNKFVTVLIIALLGVAGYVFYKNFDIAAPIEATQDTATTSGIHPACETPVAPDGVKTVNLELELASGKVLLELRPDLAPNHVERISSLAAEGFYDGIVFHRVIDGFMAQTGDPTGTGMGGSELPDLDAEFTETPYQCGTLGMARSQDPNSANSQFFITFQDARFLDNQYTVFGFVREGMDLVHKIKKGEGQSGTVTDPDKIVALKVLDH